MLQATKPQKPKGRTKFRGICAAALALDVERTHLYRVLTGERESKSLLKRYKQFTKGEAAQ